MGSGCSEQQSSAQYQLVRQFQSQGLGYIEVYQHQIQHTLKATKTIRFDNENQLQKYEHEFQLAKACNVPSLIKLKQLHHEEKINQCGFCELKIQFDFHEQNLHEQFLAKQALLRNYESKNKLIVQKCRSIPLYNYKEIDKLKGISRQFVNVYYREIQILRMIDHMISAIYFLNHFQVTHQAIRPDAIFITPQNINVVANRKLFKLQTNYERALRIIMNENLKKNPYLPPQYFQLLKNKSLKLPITPQKTDIFSIGLIALQMCVMEDVLPIYDFTLFKVVKSQINRYLVKAKSRYSDELINLLQNMLKIDPTQRINYIKLIQILHPILQTNIKNFQEVFKQTVQQDCESYRNKSFCNDLQMKLQHINMKINKIYRHRGFSIVREFGQSTFEEEKQILQELRCQQVYVRNNDRNYYSEQQRMQLMSGEKTSNRRY